MNKIDICEELSYNFLDSSYETNCRRAFPDIRDGLKDGQRACLWEMYTKKYTSKKPHVKSAKISGGVAALWWPHGTTAIYETFARMSQPFTNNIPEVDFHGSNGNIILGGDAIAADRYTEARLSPITESGMLAGINKNVVPMQLNFSEDDKWPTVFPAIFPRLLVNGAQGIGVSLSNVWLPHGFTETAELILHYIETGELDEDNYYPDFPTGGTIINKDDLATINKTGRGKVIVESKYRIAGQEIDFYELPYQVFIEPVIDEIKKAINEEKVTGIIDVYNKSDKKRISLVVTCMPGIEPDKVITQLFTATNLRKQFNANQNGIISKTPIMITLKKYVDTYIEHNTGCIKREYEYDLAAARKRVHILEGLSIALENIDNVLALIKQSENKAIAAVNLCEKYHLSREQADAILAMTLSRLTNMDQIAIANELQEKKQLALTCQEVVESYKKQTEILAERLRDLVKKFGDKRRTSVTQKEIIKTSASKKVKDQIIEDVIVVYTPQGYLKSIPIKSYRNTSNQDQVIKCRTDDMILLFSSFGKMYRIKVSEIKQCLPKDKGTAVGALLSLQTNEKILLVSSMNIDEKKPYITGVTRYGLIKKSEKLLYIGSTQNLRGMKAAGLKEGDEYIAFFETNGDYIILRTSNNMGIQFNINSEVRATGKTSCGVIGIKLQSGEQVIEATIGTEVKRYPTQHRGGKGFKIS